MGREKSIISRLPHFYQSEEIFNVLYQLIDVYGDLLDNADLDLVKVMRSHWVNTADNEGSKGFNTSSKGDLDKIFSLYIENLGGTSLLKQSKRREGDEGLLDDKIYRDRIKGLINVLQNGASTKEGITKIVAANLGIIGEDVDAVEAMKGIRIIEYLPEKISTEIYQLKLFETFTVINPNRVPSPVEIEIKFDPNFLQPFGQPRILNRSTGQSAQYEGVVPPGATLTFLPDNRATLPGQEVDIIGSTPMLPPGESKWRVEAIVGFPAGQFDNTYFDYSRFETESTTLFGIFDESHFDEVNFPLSEQLIELNMSFFRIHPASFKLSIDWDSPGFSTNIVLTDQSIQSLLASSLPTAVTDALEELKGIVYTSKAEFREALQEAFPDGESVADHLPTILEQAEFPDKFAQLDVNPRNQIKYIVDKVKAAGVYTEVAYQKRFVETQQMDETFIPQLIFEEDANMEDDHSFSSVQSPYPDGLAHEMSDSLVLSGVFDYTRFNSLNTFA